MASCLSACSKKVNKKRLSQKDKNFFQKGIELVNKLGSPALIQLGKQLTEAKIILEKSVTVTEAFFSDSLLLADAYSNLGKSYLEGKIGTHTHYEDLEDIHIVVQGLRYLKKALQINIDRLGENHILTARAYFDVGYHWAILGNMMLLLNI